MDAKTAIKINVDMGDFITKGYLGDLSDSDLMHRPAANANHIKWQLGHLITSEHEMVETCFPGSMPALPQGFAEKYKKETAVSNNPADFHSKAELMATYEAQRQGTLKKLAEVSNEDLGKSTPEAMHSYAPNVGAMFSLQGSHWVMHAGQWAVIRRQLGRAPLF